MTEKDECVGVTLICDCCGHSEAFTDLEEAFEKGWDAPPHFRGYVACDLCPASNQFRPDGWAHHASIHQQWKEHGRPKEFSQETCIAPEDHAPEESLALIQEVLDGDGDVVSKVRKLFALKDEGKL